jgi:hypothetical protein
MDYSLPRVTQIPFRPQLRLYPLPLRRNRNYSSFVLWLWDYFATLYQNFQVEFNSFFTLLWTSSSVSPMLTQPGRSGTIAPQLLSPCS